MKFDSKATVFMQLVDEIMRARHRWYREKLSTPQICVTATPEGMHQILDSAPRHAIYSTGAPHNIERHICGARLVEVKPDDREDDIRVWLEFV